MVVLEAMAHGLPVVVSNAKFCGIAADLEDGQDALLIKDPKSSIEIAKCVDRILTDEGFAGNISAKATEFAQTRLWTEVASEHELLFAKVSGNIF
jgi:UDP-glucose:(heptosyl)LPS alpha-1,3-glucosyltransferase